VADGIEVAPWARELLQVIVKEPGGEWFLTVAAGLHYMAGKPDMASALQGGDDASDGDDADQDGDDDHDEFDDDEDGNQPGDARARKEAGADWLAGQGFDRKD
ncbi:MAG: hypothetical protein ABIX00_02940, partial [Polaromonas sp.]